MPSDSDRYGLQGRGRRKKTLRIRAELFHAVLAAEVIILSVEFERSGSGFRIHGHAANGIDRAAVTRAGVIMHVFESDLRLDPTTHNV